MPSTIPVVHANGLSRKSENRAREHGDSITEKKSSQNGQDDRKRSREERRREKTEKKERKRKRQDEDGNADQEYKVDHKPEKKEKRKKLNQRPSPNDAAEPNIGSSPSDYEASKLKYAQSAALSALAQPEIDTFLSSNGIATTDPESTATLRPIIHFAHLPSTPLLDKSPFAEFKTPTPIQAASWPFVLSGRDVVGVAETGSGKTLAFALPCIESLYHIRKQRGIKAVIVSPTRELAMQTHTQVEALGALVHLKCVCVYGGASKDEQRKLIKRGVDIIVATPGRLKDFMADGTCDLSKTRFVVLDEADRMLDKGFEDDIKAILGATLPKERRQTLMFTATWPASVQALASTFMIMPVRINIGSGAVGRSDGGVELQANARITQKVEVVDPRGKEQRLLQILKQWQQGKKKNDRILVFCLYKKEATRVETFLGQRGIRVCGIHGDLRQEQRTRSLAAFKSGSTPVLVATDVAARGLDIPEVKLVINLTFPLTIEDYVHRIGRTGRAGKTGEAITLFTLHDRAHSGALCNVLRVAGQSVPEELLKFGGTVKKKAHPQYGAFYRESDPSMTPAKIVFDD